MRLCGVGGRGEVPSHAGECQVCRIHLRDMGAMSVRAFFSPKGGGVLTEEALLGCSEHACSLSLLEGYSGDRTHLRAHQGGEDTHPITKVNHTCMCSWSTLRLASPEGLLEEQRRASRQLPFLERPVLLSCLHAPTFPQHERRGQLVRRWYLKLFDVVLRRCPEKPRNLREMLRIGGHEGHMVLGGQVLVNEAFYRLPSFDTGSKCADQRG